MKVKKRLLICRREKGFADKKCKLPTALRECGLLIRLLLLSNKKSLGTHIVNQAHYYYQIMNF